MAAPARKEKPERGVVVAVGEGKRNDRGDLIPLRLKKGDVVIFSKYGYDEVKIDDVEYYIIAESRILARNSLVLGPSACERLRKTLLAKLP